MSNFFTIEKRINGSLGRTGVLKTDHGVIETPAFSPVGTKATIKSLTVEDVKSTNSQVILANTYHLFLQPGENIIKQVGGIHKFMNWSGPVITDSGGYQVFSLGSAYGKDLSKITKNSEPTLQIPERSEFDDGIARLATIGRDGVSFRSHLDGSLNYITPEKAIRIQHDIGADIIFAFDECTSPTDTYDYQKESLDRTHAWAKRCLVEHEKIKDESSHKIFLFGIVQGGRFKDLREYSANIISNLKTDNGLEFDGYGIGGSFLKEDIQGPVVWINSILEDSKPKHLLGIGEIPDIFIGVENGIDLFDCVAPTRMSRNGTLHTINGKINILNSQYKNDFSPIDDSCECSVCQNYTKAYVSHLFRSKEMLGATLATIHNLFFMNNLMANIRQSIREDNFHEYKNKFLSNYKI